MADPRDENDTETTLSQDDAAPDEVEAKASPRPVWIWALAAILLLGLAGAGFVFGPQFFDRPPSDLWAEASYTPDPDCEAGSAECPVLIEPFPVGHGGDASETALTLLAVTYPELDDSIAQWGQCMDTVLSCLAPAYGESDATRAGSLRSCVAQSSCPQACRDRFESRAGSDLESSYAAFLETFVEEDAWCAPQD
ncbi:hypothetical protein [Maricaulis parjimensis]|uniref:hypothetical protein n=1 Tax=Maricaulis parjimensis TaxID=144023 RepID=UPI00193A8576|nr:hypothetical protein [Maricaulis parjimensis]